MSDTHQLSRQDLWSLEDYAAKRPEYRKQVMEHKTHRQVALGPNATLYFEDRLTIQYQIQEMLRIEKVFEAAGIEEELEAYNPLIPDGCNWKATFMIEYEDPEIRSAQLAKMIGIEDLVWVQVDGFDKVWSMLDEAQVDAWLLPVDSQQIPALEATGRWSIAYKDPIAVVVLPGRTEMVVGPNPPAEARFL